ncbi:Vacuolar protein sorting-associated protein 13C [Trichostrongylus colubriformis]|uniref:Vacuolar protein sorting-associated protein 13C n=1 Tax=Trichostrongylus colubriformis TaxID=6319 RepID=A0AAN8F5H4_TRICO
MVFESLVADLLNRFLGDFVDNLDASQLNIGIWGGDVKLENLEVKETALDDLDLPIKLKFGHLSTLVLKIPWKNLYNEPVIANIDGLQLIVVPNKGVVYNDEKAKKNAAEVKQKTLARLEEARKNRRKPPDPTQDSFAEKMITQVIKNLQVTVSNIHVRFEDKYTNRHRPFVAGITLESLNFQTTNENWIPTIHKDVVKIFHKLVLLENLAVYWNSGSELFSDLSDKKEIRRKLQATIHNGKNQPDGYKYILQPIKMQAKLKLNQKPESDGTDWQTPKIDLSVDMETLALAIGKFQYQDILLFLEAQERFNLATQYLKYRPNLNEYRGHYKEWWHFAYTAILEEKVRRRRNNWSWPRMRAHRKLVRQYRDAWLKQQTEKSPGSEVTDIIKKAEEQLDVFNVNIARQQAEMDIDRQGLKRVEDQPQGWLAWGASWFTGGGDEQKTPNKKTAKDFAAQFNEAMTPAERERLFEAIDYQENMPPTNYPKEFVENKVDFRLKQVAVAIDGAVSLNLLDLRAHLKQRPSAKAMNLKSSIQELRMDGCGAEMLRVRDPSKPWLSMCVDTNPLDGKYDQSVQLAIAPVNLKYHAPAVNGAVDVFKPPESVKLNQLAAAAMSRYEEVKARSVTGLAHAVENRFRLVLDIQIQPATIYVSEGGVYDSQKPTILADLGHLSITTVESDPSAIADKDKLHQLMDKAYDKFRMKLSNVVVCMADNVETGRAALSDKNSPLHVLKPTGLDIQIHKCSIDDLRLPRIRLMGALPDIIVGISDTRLLLLTRVLLSVPTPEPDPTPPTLETKLPDDVNIKTRAKMKTIMETQEVETEEEKKEEAKTEGEASKTHEQQVQVELDLHLNQIGLIVMRGNDVLCDVSLVRMGCKLQMRTFDMVVNAELGAIRISMPMFKSLDPMRKNLYLIDNDEHEGSLMTLKFVQANPESPFFATEYRSTEQAIDFKFRKLNIALHQEGLLELKIFGEKMQREINALQKGKEGKVEEVIETGRKLSRQVSRMSVDSFSSRSLDRKTSTSRRRRIARSVSSEEVDRTIKMRLDASVGSLAVMIGTEDAVDTLVAIENIQAQVKMTVKAMDVIATLKTVRMEDMTEGAIYRKLLSVTGDKEMLRFEMTQYQRSDEEKKRMGPEEIDMKVKVRMAEMRFVFLNLWLSRLMAWNTPFQEEAARAAAAAQAAASEKAQEAAENVKQMLAEHPPRIQLDVQLEAPVILLPQLSTSRNVVVLVLGRLIVNNHITGDNRNSKLILDRMEVKLLDMKFGIGSVNSDGTNLHGTCDILQPLSFSVTIHRNLVFSICKDLPEIAVDAQIPSLAVNMSEQDYSTLMQTLSGNLAEGNVVQEPPPPPPAVSVDEVDHADEDKDKADETDRQEKKKTITHSSSAPKTPVTPPPVEVPKQRIVFQFSLDQIVAVLYTGGTEGTHRPDANAFASMKLLGLKLSGSMKEDNSLTVAISMNAFTMADERRAQTKIHQLLDKKSSNETERFIALAYSQDAQQNKNVKLKMSEFFLCLCPEFLGCIARFFTVTQSPEQRQYENDSLKAAKATQIKQAAAGNATAQSDVSPPSMILDCDMQGVEVILVENSMEPDTSQALILAFNMKMVATPSAKEQVMRGGIEKLAIFSSYYAPWRRNEVTYEVLKPVNIGIDMTIDTPTKATNVVLKMSPMEVRMAPSIIRLLSNVNAEFAKSSGVQDPSSASLEMQIPSFPNYWRPRRIEQKKFWFYNTPTAEEACEAELENIENLKSIRAPIEHAHVEIERINFTLEAGSGTIPVPLIFMQLLVKAEASGWSSALQASANLSLQMSYYNESLSVWEPVIEPVESGTDNWSPWNLTMTVKGRDKNDQGDSKPGMDVKIDADDMLNVTVTKTFISLLNHVSEEFANAAKKSSPPLTRQLPGLSAFLVLNETGIIIKVAGSDSIQINETGEEVEAPHGRFVDLYVGKEAAAKAAESQEKERLSVNQTELSAYLRVNLLDTVRQLKIGRAEKVSVPLPKKSDAGKQWKIIADTTIENGRRLITFKSHVSVTNHLDVPMELYAKNGSNLDLFGTVPPGETLQLAVPLLFTPTGEIFFRPANDKCEVSFESVTWHNFMHNRRQCIRCDLSDDTTKGYFFDTVVREERVREGIDQHTEVYTMHLYPPLQFHNILPFPITLEIPVAMDLSPGECTLLNVIPGHRLRLWAPYLGEMYSLDMKIPEEKKDLEVVALNTDTGSSELLLGLHWSTDHGDLKVYLYAPFWLVNNTSKTLKHMECGGNFLQKTTQCVPCKKAQPSQQESEYAVKHLPEENPLILPFPTTDLKKKKKSRVLVDDKGVQWSEELPLDTVGNAARVVCEGKDRDYELTVDIKLCKSGLTKIVTFCPFYLVSNLSKWNMEVREEGSSTWVLVPAEKCVGVWPQQSGKRKFLCARYEGQQEESILFPITENFETLCHLDNDQVGIEVCVTTSDSSVSVHLSPFQQGMAPVCIMNSLKMPVTFGQKGHEMKTVNSGEMMYFTWANVTRDKILEYKVGSHSGEDKLDQNRFADIQVDPNVRRFVYLANFLIGRQRIILFTKDLDIARAAYGSWETDTVHMQVELALQGVGLSIVDNSVGKELLYIGISSSSILWEEEVKKGRFKPFAVKYMQSLEEKYQEHLVEPRNEYQPVDQYEVSFENMILKKKKGKEVKIRRIFEKGIWALYGKSAERIRLHLKINHMQVDNQLETCVFPRVLCNVPPPKSVVADNAPKPFVELSFLQKQSEFSTVPEVEYARVLVQEFAVQVDQGLINALLTLIASEVNKEPYRKELFEADMATALERLEDTAMKNRSHQPRAFYNDLHISPLMIHLSFSQGGTTAESGGTASMPIQSEFFKVLFQSVGVSITELQDVVFKLAYFERKCVFYRTDQLMGEIIYHYTKQALRQLYVLVLGLDIIGNPFGLVRDLSAGVEDLFYQPFQGLIQGPEEFASGVALGVQSMLGHAVGGAAGAVGRITGTVGKGVAALTFDQEYQRKRQEDLNRPPQTFAEGMARGVKGLGAGVIGGISGIVTKPIEGAKQEGGVGFFKGVGKGLIGVVTRPVSGVVDFASSTMHSVRRVAGATEAGPLRPPRVIRPDHLIRPYSYHDALGFKIFNDTDHGELAETDEYITYAQITDRVVLLVTNVQLVLSKRTDLMGTWATDWNAEYDKIKEPTFVEKGIKIVLKEKKRGFLGIGSTEGKIITFDNAEDIQQKVLAAYRAATQLPA